MTPRPPIGIYALSVAAALVFARLAAGQESNHAAAFQPRSTVRNTNSTWQGSCTYSLVSGQFFEWNTDPTAVPGLFREVGKRVGIACGIDVGAISLDSARVAVNPLIIMTGNRVFRLSDAEIQNLRSYLLGGGFIYADDCGGSDFSFRRMIKQIVPEGELLDLPPSHPLFSAFYRIESVPKIVDLYRGPARLLGVTMGGRLAAVYTYDTDVPCAWEIYPDGSYVHVIPPEKRESAFQLGVNVVLYALAQRAAPEAAANAPAARRPRAEPPPATAFPPAAVRVYRMKRQLPCDHIAAIAGDENAVWFGGWSYLPGEDEGLARYDRRTGEFALYMDAEGVLAEEINALAVHGGKVYIGADTWKFSRGLSILNPANRSWTSYTTANGLPHDRVIDVQFRGQEAWIACRSGLAVWNSEQDEFRKVDVPGGDLRDLMICIAATDSAVWISNFEHVWRLVPRGSRDQPETQAPLPRGEADPAAEGDVYAHLNPGPPSPQRMPFLGNARAGGPAPSRPDASWEKGEDLTPLLRGSAGAIACGGGRVYIAPLTPSPAPIVVYDERSGKFSPFPSATDSGLESVTALAVWQPLHPEIAADSASPLEVWAGTAKGDIVCFSEDSDGHTRVSTRQHLANGKVLRIHARGDDVFASAADFGGAWHYDRQRRAWRQFRTRASVPSDHVFALAGAGATLFAGTLSDGPWSFTASEEERGSDTPSGDWHNLNYELLREGQRLVYLGDHDAIRYSSIYDLAIAGGRVWMASNHGLLLHDPARTPRGFEIIPSIKEPLSRLALGKDTVYCGQREGGIGVFDAAKHAARGGWRSGERITALAAQGATVWVGTDSHLFRLADESSALTEVSNRTAAVSSLFADEGGVWIATQEGIYRHMGTGFPDLERPAVPIRGAAVLLPAGPNRLFAANEEGLWRVRMTEDGALGALVRYDLSPFIGDHPATAMAIEGARLYIGSAGGGLLSVAADDLP